MSRRDATSKRIQSKIYPRTASHNALVDDLSDIAGLSGQDRARDVTSSCARSNAARQFRLPADPPGTRVVQTGREADRRARPDRFEERAEYAYQVTATDHLRMHRKDENAVPRDVAQEV